MGKMLVIRTHVNSGTIANLFYDINSLLGLVKWVQEDERVNGL